MKLRMPSLTPQRTAENVKPLAKAEAIYLANNSEKYENFLRLL
jgi:hypothetical protein